MFTDNTALNEIVDKLGGPTSPFGSYTNNTALNLINELITGSSSVGSLGLENNLALQKPDIGDVTIIEDKAYRFIQAIGGGDIEWFAEGTKVTLNCTTNTNDMYSDAVKTEANGRAAIEIPFGASDQTKMSITCAILDMDDGDTITDADVLLANFQSLPTGTFLSICIDALLDKDKTVANGPIVSQRTTETTDKALFYMRQNTRMAKHGSWWSGCSSQVAFTPLTAQRDKISLLVTQGQIFQMHLQSFPMKDSNNGIYVTKPPHSKAASVSNYQMLANLNEIMDCDCGEAITDGKRFVIDIYGHINDKDENCKLLACTPTRLFDTDQEAIDFATSTPFKKLEWSSRTVGFPICRIVLQYVGADGGSYINVLSNTQTSTDVWKTETVSGIDSPNYPNNYGINENSTTRINSIIGTKSIRARFQDFDTEANYDYVRIYNDDTSQLLATYHGRLGSWWNTSVFNCLNLRFVFTSDGSVTRKGFKVYSYDYLITQTQSANGSIVMDARLY